MKPILSKIHKSLETTEKNFPIRRENQIKNHKNNLQSNIARKRTSLVMVAQSRTLSAIKWDGLKKIKTWISIHFVGALAEWIWWTEASLKSEKTKMTWTPTKTSSDLIDPEIVKTSWVVWNNQGKTDTLWTAYFFQIINQLDLAICWKVPKSQIFFMWGKTQWKSLKIGENNKNQS